MEGDRATPNGSFRPKPSLRSVGPNGSKALFDVPRPDMSLTASGPVYMNERPKLGSERGGPYVHL